MSVLALGVSHHSADLDLLERLAVPGDEIPKTLRSLVSLEHVVESAVLSTCNRMEIYAHVSMFHPAIEELREWLALRGGLEPGVIDRVAYWRYDDRAAAHLFAVAAGLDSMIVGEQQIAAQVRQAANDAREEGTARRVLQKLFREAVKSGRRIRRETAIDSGASSIVDVGVELAGRHLGGGLAGRTVTLVGAGTMGGLAADRLEREGALDVLVWNRTTERAEALAARVGGRALGRGDLAEGIAAADLVVCTTGAPVPLVDRELVVGAMDSRPERPLLLLDLAVPRNVARSCAGIDGVELLGLADLREVTDRRVTGRVIEAAREIVEEEAREFLAWQRAWEVEPTIKALRARAEEIRRGELDRLASTLEDLDEQQREDVEALSRSIVNTLLHDPTVRLKDLADSGGAEHYVNALRELFDLDE